MPVLSIYVIHSYFPVCGKYNYVNKLMNGPLSSNFFRGCHGSDCMAVGFATTCATSAHHH